MCRGEISPKLIIMQTKIRPYRLEFLFKINKRACTSIWYTRVVIYGYSGKKILLLSFPKIESGGWNLCPGTPGAAGPAYMAAIYRVKAAFGTQTVGSYHAAGQ